MEDDLTPDPTPAPDPAAAPEPSPDPSPAPEPTPAGLVGEDFTFKEGWIDELGEEFEDGRPTLSKYGDIKALAKSHISLQKMMGERAGKLNPLTPESTPEEVSKFRKAFGVPEEAAGYGIKAPDNLPEGMQWNQEQADAYGEVLHKHHAPPAMVEELMAMNAQAEIQRQEQSEAAYDALVAEGTAELKKDWGSDYDKNIADAQRGAATLGLDPKGPFFNDPQIVKAMARMTGLVSESKLVTGHENPSLMDGPTRAQEIMNNPTNPYYQRYYEGDEKVQAMVAGLLKQGK